MKKKAPQSPERMLTEKPLKLIVEFCVPTIAMMLVNSMYNLVDKAFVGNSAGYLGVTALTLCNIPMQVMTALTMLVGVGGAAYYAMQSGAGEDDRRAPIIGTAISALALLGAAILIFGTLFLEQWCIWVGASAESLPYAKDYIGVIFLGAVFNVVGAGLLPLIRADGSPNSAMLFSIAGTAANIILDPIFIYAFGMGVKGAAIATILAQLLTMVLALRYFLGGHGTVRVELKQLRPARLHAGRMFSLGAASFARQATTCLMSLLLTRTLVYYGNASGVGGDVAVGSMGMAGSISSFIAMTGLGTEQGMIPLMAYNHGAGNSRRVRRLLFTAIWTLFAVLFVLWAIVMIFSGPLINIFGETADLDFAIKFLRIYNLVLPTMAFQTLGTGYFQATDRAKTAGVLSLVRPLFLMIPLILILPLFFGLTGAVAVAPVADSVSAGITMLLVLIAVKKEKAAERLAG